MVMQEQSTIDQNEIEKFKALAELWWDETGPFKPLHIFNPSRVEYIREKAYRHFQTPKDKPLENLTLIDIGCGGGLLAEPMCQSGAKVTGVDAIQKNINIASYHAVQTQCDIEYKCMTAEDMAATGKTYDIVLAMEIIEHVADIELFMDSLFKLVNPGGLVFIATINRTVKSFTHGIIGAEYIMRWLPIGTHQWHKFVKPSEITNYMEYKGLVTDDVFGMKYSFFKNPHWSISKNKSINFVTVHSKPLLN
jgi:2-polyprenyl-6-hydroxyphenyl methylase/3-demethylubiquinone-9 3-methyltransferase